MKTIHIVSITLSALCLFACGDNKIKNRDDNFNYPATDPLLTTVKAEKGQDSLNNEEKCFVAHIKKDSAFLSLKKSENKITGTLHYKFLEKDNTRGKLDGFMNGDTLELNYTFTSEGKTSERPIRFIYEKGNIYEIYNKKRPSKDSAFIYLPVNCDVRQ